MAVTLAQTGRCHLAPGVPGSSREPWGTANLGDHVGDSAEAVAANRAALTAALDVTNVVFMHQVHGSTVIVVDGPAAPTGDALVTVTPGLALAVMTADCVPVLLADPDAGVAGAVHAGRNGVRLDVVGAAVQAMRDLGATAITARIGPHIGACCYEVGTDVQAELADVLPVSRATTTWGTPALDLGAGVRAQLAAAGVRGVSADGRCTVTSPDLFSYRRDPVTGRMAAVIAITR